MGQKATKCIRYTGYPRTGKSGKHEYYTSGAKYCQCNKNMDQRKLTLYGKTTIIKSLLESQLIYRLSVLPSPDMSIMNEIDKTLFDFLWDKKPHKIAKKVTIKPKIKQDWQWWTFTQKSI